MGYRLFTCTKELICIGVVYTPNQKIILFLYLLHLNGKKTSKMGYRLFTCTKELICIGVVYTPNQKIILFLYLLHLNGKKTSKESVKLKFDSIWTSILREIDVDLTSMCWEKHIAYKKEIPEICVCLATKIRS